MKRLPITVLAVSALALALTNAPSAATPAAAPSGNEAGNTADRKAGAHGWNAYASRPSGQTGWPRGRLGPRPTVQVGGHRYPAANPYLALLPTSDGVDWNWWTRHLQRLSARRAADRPAPRLTEPMTYDELEPANLLGSNDSRADAEPIDGFGTGAGELAGVSILGRQANERTGFSRIKASREDDGSIPRARGTGVPAQRGGVRTTGTIGDGPHGSSGSGSGDFDYLRVKVPAGHQIIASMDARGTRGELDPLIAIWGAKGALKDYDFPRRHHVDLTTAVSPGTYYVMAGGCCTYPRSRFRSGSGTGAESEGKYRFSVAVARADRDFFAVDLEAGDVLGGTLSGARLLSVFGPDGTKVFESTFDASAAYPADTPLPGGGLAVVDHVAADDGTYVVGVTYGRGGYQADLEVYRPGPEEPAGVQTLFLDFDGERLNTGIFGGPGVRELSPLSAFLGRWGLTPRQEDAVIDAVTAIVQENVDEDIQAAGLDGRFAVQVLNSRDDPDTFGDPDVSRVIIGGSIRESGVPTIGVAQSIDPGNFDQEESALLLLDYLSGPAEDPFSVNHWLTPRSDRVAFVSQVLANIASHEAGHFLGNWHVDQFDASPNLMDQGGNPRAMFGPGPDRIGGTADDRDVDFGVDRLNPNEGFRGLENTLVRTAFALTDGLL